MSTQDLTADKKVSQRADQIRKEIKDKFDAKPTNDASYIIYHMVDQHIPDDTTKDKILRITQFFNTLSFVESVNDAIRDAYLEHNHLRYGFLTNGALFSTKKNGEKVEVDRKYNINELSLLNDKEYQSILDEIDVQLNNIGGTIGEVDKSLEKWYFWPGCEMKMPESTTILVDTSVQRSKFVVTNKLENSDEATQIVMEEKPYQLEVSLLGDNEFYYKENEKSDEQKLKPGFFSINRSKPEFENVVDSDFSEVDLALKKGEKYHYTLYVPYNSPRLDILTNMEISSTDDKVEEFIATCT